MIRGRAATVTVNAGITIKDAATVAMAELEADKEGRRSSTKTYPPPRMTDEEIQKAIADGIKAGLASDADARTKVMNDQFAARP